MKIVSRVVKITCLVVLFAVIGILIARIAMADYFPSAMKDLSMTEGLYAACADDGQVEVRTQKLRASYDNPNFALFMADHLYYSPEAGELQITLRYNNNTLKELQHDFGLRETPAAAVELFTYTLVSNSGKEDLSGEAIPGVSYDVAHIETDSKFMYQYLKLTFTGVSFAETVGWYRLEIGYAGNEAAIDENAAARWPAMIAVWEKEMIPYDEAFTLTAEDFDR